MPTIVMFWDEIDIFGDPLAGIRIENNHHAIEIPGSACGFRIGLPGHDWFGSWYFAQKGVPGSTFQFQGIPYSSAFTGKPSPDAIQARGPVHGCSESSGTYNFQTPLGALGITGDDPVLAGAGSFRADFDDEGDLEWLDFAGKPITLPSPGTGPSPPKLPPEFFEEPPNVKGCFRDFEGKLHCPTAADTSSMAPEINSLALPPPDVAMLVASGGGILPRFKSIEVPSGSENSTQGSKVEVSCPAELILTATFFKDPTFQPATVKYRFRFAHGPVSTIFSVLVDKEGANSFSHSVPIPLPEPVGQTGGGGVPPGPAQLTIFVKPEDPPFQGGGTPAPASQTFAVEALPDNEHKSSVCVEVVNASEGAVFSNWATYHLVCSEASTRPKLGMGALGADVTALQSGLNRWLKSREMPPIRVDGRFGLGTEAAIRAFHEDHGLALHGRAEEATWRQLLALVGRASS